MEKSRYIQPQTYMVSCINTCALLAGSGPVNISGELPDGSKIDSGGDSSNDRNQTGYVDAKKHNTWNSWDD